ncbi:hypothetical protein [Sporomusa sp. GT1]|uniref:hypothetical protein n=1 Tax=Sporomusa sp. GT1 TaxID=1534747 RepID=UPI0016643579|nr:hypothetical protein [Sporomusa sp. GT1]
MKLEKVKYGSHETIHIRDKDSKTSNVSLCGYAGYFKSGVSFGAMPTSLDTPLCKKCKKIAKSKLKGGK